jgi:hypothetical protein
MMSASAKERDLKFVWWVLLLCPLAVAAPCDRGEAKHDAALIQTEQRWARALEQRDTASLNCILAKEFEDAGPDGTLTNRATNPAKAAERPALHHTLSDLRAHVEGDFGYIRGLATAVDAQGNIVARVRFTDIYAYRKERWQYVAGQESMLPKATH